MQRWHALAKTLSEKTAWALAMDRGVDMVAINAGMLLAAPGPGLGLGLTAAHPYLKGAPDMYDGGILATVDVRLPGRRARRRLRVPHRLRPLPLLQQRRLPPRGRRQARPDALAGAATLVATKVTNDHGTVLVFVRAGWQRRTCG